MSDVDVTPPVQDGTVLVCASDLVGRDLRSTDDGTRAVARREGPWVVVEFPERGPFHRFVVGAEDMVRIHSG